MMAMRWSCSNWTAREIPIMCNQLIVNEEEDKSDFSVFISLRMMIFAVPAAFYAYTQSDSSSPATMGVKCKIYLYISKNEKTTTVSFFVWFLFISSNSVSFKRLFLCIYSVISWMNALFLPALFSRILLRLYVLSVSSQKQFEHMETKRMHIAQTTKHKQLIRR